MILHVPEVCTEPSGLLEGLREHLVLFDVVVGHGPPGKLHGVLKVPLCDLWDGIVVVIDVHGGPLERQDNLNKTIPILSASSPLKYLVD